MTNTNIPQNDSEALSRSPSLCWMYLTPVLLERQKLSWSVVADQTHTVPMPYCTHDSSQEPGVLYVVMPSEPTSTAVIYLQRGEVKKVQQFASDGSEQELQGEAEIKLQALSYLYLNKFTGAVTCYLSGSNVMRMIARPDSRYALDHILLKKLYKK